MPSASTLRTMTPHQRQLAAKYDDFTGHVVRDIQQLEEFGLVALDDDFQRAKTALLALTEAIVSHR